MFTDMADIDSGEALDASASASADVEQTVESRTVRSKAQRGVDDAFRSWVLLTAIGVILACCGLLFADDNVVFRIASGVIFVVAAALLVVLIVKWLATVVSREGDRRWHWAAMAEPRIAAMLAPGRTGLNRIALAIRGRLATRFAKRSSNAADKLSMLNESPEGLISRAVRRVRRAPIRLAKIHKLATKAVRYALLSSSQIERMADLSDRTNIAGATRVPKRIGSAVKLLRRSTHGLREASREIESSAKILEEARGFVAAAAADAASHNVGVTALVAQDRDRARTRPGVETPLLGERQIGPVIVLSLLFLATAIAQLGGFTSSDAHGVRWSILTIVVCAVASYGFSSRRGSLSQQPVHELPKPDPQVERRPDPLGLSCSGGGVRSASFSLGAMQAFQQDQGGIDKIDYLSAVSGGGYAASALTYATANTVVADGDPLAFAPGSPEERWLRHNSNYIVPNKAKTVGGLIRLLGGVIVNVVIIWLLIFVLVRPLGWISHELHVSEPEQVSQTISDPVFIGGDESSGWSLQAENIPIDAQDSDRVRFVIRLEPPGTDAGGLWALAERPDEEPATSDQPNDGPGDDQTSADEPESFSCTGALKEGALFGVVELIDGQRAVLQQPSIKAADLTCTGTSRDAVSATLTGVSIDFDREIGDVSDWRTNSQALLADLDVTTDIRVATDLATGWEPTFSSWMTDVPAALAGIGALAGIVTMLGRFTGPTRWGLRFVFRLSVFTATGIFLVAVAIPWAVQKLIDGWSTVLPAADLPDGVLPSAGVLALLGSAARAYASIVGSEKGDAPGRLRSLWKTLSSRKKELGWYELTPAKILMSIVLGLALVAVIVEQLRHATANGVDLQQLRPLTDWGWTYWMTPELEFVRWLAATVALLLLHTGADASSWSLHPYYKEQLSSAYLVTREGSGATATARPVDYSEATEFPSDKPELVLCCAANLSEPGIVPPPRKASSFTFSRTEIGSPITGYLTAEEVKTLRGTHTRREIDLTLLSAMSISGAAFSPGMGKKNMGAVGSMLALANLRLGVWLPNPAHVHELDADRVRLDGAYKSPFRRPGWYSWLYEVRNWYPADRRYVYVSDGGHWENLGLVELLRRRCTRIICISASGDGPDKFTTLAEAVALAREELGVSISIDPMPLAQLPDGDESYGLAEASYVMGEVLYPDGTKGEIVFIEAALTEDVPFDINGFDKVEADFPHDTTADQVFNHQQFEAYRQLGFHQMSKFLASEDVEKFNLDANDGPAEPPPSKHKMAGRNAEF